MVAGSVWLCGLSSQSLQRARARAVRGRRGQGGGVRRKRDGRGPRHVRLPPAHAARRRAGRQWASVLLGVPTASSPASDASDASDASARATRPPLRVAPPGPRPRRLPLRSSVCPRLRAAGPPPRSLPRPWSSATAQPRLPQPSNHHRGGNAGCTAGAGGLLLLSRQQAAQAGWLQPAVTALLEPRALVALAAPQQSLNTLQPPARRCAERSPWRGPWRAQ